MASKYNYRGKFYISYTLNGERKVKNTGLEFHQSNEHKAELVRRKVEELEKKNKLKIKYGLVRVCDASEKITLYDVYVDFLKTLSKPTVGKNHHEQTLKVTMTQFFKVTSRDRKISTVSENDIKLFVKDASLRANATSIRTYLRYLKAFFNFALEKKYIKESPIKRRVIPKETVKAITIFEKDDLNLFLEKAKMRDIEYFRIYKMLLLTGMRPNDLFSLKAGDFNLKDKLLRLTISKTSRVIDYPIHKELETFLNSDYPALESMSKNEILFKKYCVERIGKTFRKIIKETGMEGKGYNLKTFRKTFASVLADNGLPEGDLADLLGHTSIQTTRQYYKRKNAAAIRERIDKLGGLKIC